MAEFPPEADKGILDCLRQSWSPVANAPYLEFGLARDGGSLPAGAAVLKLADDPENFFGGSWVDGGIGIRARLRIWSRKGWGFESPSTHARNLRISEGFSSTNKSGEKGLHFMEAVVNDITEVEKEIAIQLTADELVPHFEKAYRRFQPNVELKGFRKGKVPLGLVKKMFGEKIEYDSLDTVASDLYREVAKEKNIHPIGEPVLVDIDYKRGESLSFKIKYEILPPIQLKEYKGIKVQKLVHAITQREVDEEIQRIRRANATTVETKAAEDDEHIITADIQELDDTGFPMIGKKNENQRFYLGDESLPAEVKSALRSATVGAVGRIHYASQHGDHNHKVHLQATVKKIEKIQLPEFDDAFVKKITKDKVIAVEEFKDQLRKDLEAYWSQRSERKLVDELAGEIIRHHDFPVPETIVNGIINRQLEDLKNRFPNKKLPADFDEAKFREESRPSAIWQAKWYLLRERIIEQEGLQVDNAELEKLAEEKAQQTSIEKEKLLEFFKKSEETQRQLLSDKLIAFLKSHAQITEKVMEEVF